MTPFIQPILTTSTTTYLHRQSLENSEEGSTQTLANTALQASYLFYLIGTLLSTAQIQSPTFAIAQRSMFLMTPVLMGVSLCINKETLPGHSFLTKQFSNGAYIASVVSSVAMLKLEKPSYALISLGVFAIEYVAQGNIHSKKVLSYTSAASAALSFLSFGAWVMDSSDSPLKIATVATGVLIVLSKLWKHLNMGSEEVGRGNASVPNSSPSPRRFSSYQFNDNSSNFDSYLPSTKSSITETPSNSNSGGSWLQQLSKKPYLFE